SRLADPADGLAFLMRKLGVAVTDNFDAYLSSLAILASGRNVPAERKVLGMSTSGAGAAILADIGEDAGLVFPSLSAEATQGLARTMRMTTPHNPLDLTGESRDPSWIEEVYAHFCASEPSAAVASLFTLLF